MTTSYWHPFSDMATVDRGAELVLRSGDGAVVTDVDGNEYLDATAGLWFCAAGHGRSRIAVAAAEQMGRLASYSTFGDVAPDVTLALSERLVELSPFARASAVLTSGGSDSIDSAIKLILRYWEELGESSRTTIIRRTHAYHGMHLGGTTIAGIPANRLVQADGGIRSAEVPWDDAEALDTTIGSLGSEQVAAFFCEPVIGAGGVYAAPVGYLERVAEICREHGVLLVLDEVITGFGRLGSWFAAERFDIEPDMIVFAKGVTSGYMPLGGLLVGPRVMEPFWSRPGAAMWRHGYTYSGHAAGCAVAMANLDVLETDSLLRAGNELETTIATACSPLAAHPLVDEVRSGVGAMAAVQLSSDAAVERPTLGQDAVLAARRHGVLTRLLASGGLQISPPLVTSTAQIDQLASGLAAALDEL